MSWTRSNLDRSVERDEDAILVDIIFHSRDDVTDVVIIEPIQFPNAQLLFSPIKSNYTFSLRIDRKRMTTA